MYTLGTALAVYSAWMLVRALGSGKAVWWVGYALTVAAFLYTHNYALFAVLAQVCFLAGYFFWWHRRHPRALLRSPEVMRACCALGGAALAYLPWVPVMLRQSERRQGRLLDRTSSRLDGSQCVVRSVLSPQYRPTARRLDDDRSLRGPCAGARCAWL